MKKLTIISSAIAFLLLSNVATYAKTTSQYTQKQNADTEQVEDNSESETEQEELTNTEQVVENNSESESEQEESTDTEQETDSETNEPQSTNNGGC